MAGSEHDEEHPLRRRRSALLRREWQLSLYPQAAEAGGCLVTTRSGEAAGRAADPERAAAEAIRRARAKIRRYGIANRLNRLATLTYEGEGCCMWTLTREHKARRMLLPRRNACKSGYSSAWIRTRDLTIMSRFRRVS